MTNWNDALRDVRNAYRIVAAYQERVDRTVQAVAAEFPVHRYHAWTPVQRQWLPALRGPTAFRDRSPWDGLPFKNYSVLFTPLDADPDRIRQSDCMIEVSVEADEAYDVWDEDLYGREAYPDPGKLKPAAESDSMLTMVAWVADKNLPKNRTWFQHVWNEHDWPDEDGVVQPQAGSGCSNFRMRWSLEDVLAAPDVSVFTKEFKTALAEASDVSL